jgi:mRNA-degrading endonuclease RelE of RelBE toxin-antitoxin system
MMFSLEPTKSFTKILKKLSQNEQRAVARKLVILSQNPYHPSLRTKKVQSLDDVFECSVNMDIRILWMYKNGRIILLLDIGHHDIL